MYATLMTTAYVLPSLTESKATKAYTVPQHGLL